jgi:two-component SAPR family response regulator
MFHIADFYFKKNSFDSALNYISQSLNISAEKQYISFLEQNFIEYRYLFDLALSNKIQPNFIRGIQESLFEKTGYYWLSGQCKKRLTLEIEKPYDIKLKTFGGLELFVRGEAVTDDKWIRKKSKLMLVYLLLNQGIKFTKDKMMDLFFQELSVESAENIFHQSITNIRNVLKPAVPELSKTDSPKKGKKQSAVGNKKTKPEQGFEPIFVIYEDKILRLNLDFFYKTDAAEFNALYSKAKSAGSTTDIKQHSAKMAIELYRGEFLAGYYESWIEELRESFLNKYIDLCNILVEIYNQKNMLFEVTVYAEKLLEADKLNEDAHVNLIESYVQLGNLNMAKNKFAAMLKIFDEELGEKPSKSALDKIQSILL